MVYLFDTPFIFKIKNMKTFIQKNFIVIVLVISILTLFKSCGDSRELSNIKKEIRTIKDSTYTKKELNLVIQIEGLKSEKRMIQSTDRKLYDYKRGHEIDSILEIKEKELK